ncbi:hypothetical protein SCH4B_1481 [Ruegeria sp. TrichCH4B]|nr:hypothetical protein SCH4B_1481 [Ruegeria sp. TrichCH4B]
MSGRSSIPCGKVRKPHVIRRCEESGKYGVQSVLFTLTHWRCCKRLRTNLNPKPLKPHGCVTT